MTGTPTLTNVADVYPLTPAQEGMLFHTVAAAGTDVYVSQVITTISGDLDTDLFERAWAAVVEQYACLRTAFLWDGLDAPLQVVRETVELAWEHVDLRDVELSRQADRVEAILAEDRARGFDLAVAPVSRMLMIRTADTEWTWVWTVHHLVADGWSDQILMDAVAAAYRDLVDGNHVGVAPEPMPYRRYVEFVKQRDVSIDEAHWRQRLAGFVGSALPDVPGLPPETDEIRYRTHDTVIDSATTRALEALARSHRVTLNTVVTAMWGVVMSRWLRSDDVVIGTTASGRPPTLAGVDRAAGMFINTIPTRMQIPQRARLSEWLPELQRTATTDRDHQLASLADIHRWSDVPAGDPLFESILVFENYPTSDDRTLGPSITLGDTAYREHSNYPLALLVIPDDELGLTFVFDESRCSPAAIESLGAQMRHVAAAFVADDDVHVASLEVTDPHPPGDTAPWLDGPALPDSTGTTCDAILEHAERTPHATAVAFGDETLSYEALADASEAIARRLIAAGAAGSRVGLHAERSIGLIVGMLGILRAGAAYVPLDPSYPSAHTATLVEDADLGAVVTTSDLANELPATVPTILIDDAGEPDHTAALPDVEPDSLAYVIYTSGSTGRPKGVAVTHANLTASTAARTVHYREPVGAFLLLSSFSFDSSIAGLFWTLTSGGTLVLPDRDRQHDPVHLIDLISRHEVSHLLALPSLYGILLETGADRLESLQVAIVAGEACPAGLYEAHLARVPRAELHNEYGPTEATVWCTVHRAGDADRRRPLPIGRPVAGTTISILDAFGKPVPRGFVGELCVSGPGLSPGYLGRPDLTAERFATVTIDGSDRRTYRTGDLAYIRRDGVIEFLGRIDAQMKIRGHRIEPEAVEAALHGLPGVVDAAVAGVRQPAGSMRLTAVVEVNGQPVDTSELRSRLRDDLPSFMVPDDIVAVDALPRLPNGKVARNRLPDLLESRPEPNGHVAPLTSVTEIGMAELWARLLERDPTEIGPATDFFEAGGDSLLAIRLISAVHSRFDTSLPLSALLEAPRLDDFARMVDGGSAEAPVLVPMGGAGPDTLYLMHDVGGNVLAYETVVRHLPDSIRVIGVQARGVDGVEDPDRTIAAMVERYADAIQRFQPEGTIHLAGHSTGGLLAYETARLLTEQGRNVGLLAMLDTMYPLGHTAAVRARRHWDTAREGRRGIRTIVHWHWTTVRSLAGRVRHGWKWRRLLAQGRRLPPELASKRINHIALKLQLTHEPGRYPGTVSYIRAAADEGHIVQSGARRWAVVSGGVVEHTAPGHHYGVDSMISETHAKGTAEVVAEAYAEAGARTSA